MSLMNHTECIRGRSHLWGTCGQFRGWRSSRSRPPRRPMSSSQSSRSRSCRSGFCSVFLVVGINRHRTCSIILYGTSCQDNLKNLEKMRQAMCLIKILGHLGLSIFRNEVSYIKWGCVHFNITGRPMSPCGCEKAFVDIKVQGYSSARRPAFCWHLFHMSKDG